MEEYLAVTEALSVNQSLSPQERLELFVEVLEPGWLRHWKQLEHSHSRLLKLFLYLDRLGGHKLEIISKAFNAMARRDKISNLELIVRTLRFGRQLQGGLTSVRQTGLPHH